MALFSAFNNLGNAISRATQNFSSVSSSISNFTSGLNSSLSSLRSSPVGNFLNSTPLGSKLSNVSNALSAVDNLLTGGTRAIANFGSSFRMAQNAFQGVTQGANPAARSTAVAVAAADVSNRTDSADTGDWRVSLSVPAEIGNSGILKPLKDLNDRMVFPFNPTVMLQHSANYTDVTPVHTNYPFHAYQNSRVDDITIMGEFFVENATDAAYWLACVHFLRTMTKMFYGSGANIGNPPLVSHLNGYGKYVLNDIPVLIKNFQVELGSDIDYIPVKVPGDNDFNYVPTQSTITVTTSPNYARRTVSKFNLKTFSEGGFVGKPEGFV